MTLHISIAQLVCLLTVKRKEKHVYLVHTGTHNVRTKGIRKLMEDFSLIKKSQKQLAVDNIVIKTQSS